MRTRRLATGLAALAVLVAGAVFALRERGERVPPGDAGSERAAGEALPPPHSVPGLKASPPRQWRVPALDDPAPDAVPPSEPMSPPIAPPDWPRAPRAGPLTVVLEHGDDIGAALLLQSHGHRVAWGLVGIGGAGSWWSVPEDVRMGEPESRSKGTTAWVVTGLFPGRHVLRLVPALPGKEPEPLWVDLGADGATVQLRVRDAGLFGEVVVTSPLPAKVEVLVRGVPWALLETSPRPPDLHRAVASVPAGVPVRLAVVEWPGAPWTRRPAPRELTFEAGQRVEVTLESAPAVAVSLRVPGAPEGKNAPPIHVWRAFEGGEHEYIGVTTEAPQGGAGPALSPGSYLAYVWNTDVGGPAWTAFDVAGPGPVTVALRGREDLRDLSVRFVDEDGAPYAGVELWLGNLGQHSPREISFSRGTTKPDGRAALPAVPAGDYLLADFSTQTWCDVRVTGEETEIVVVRPRVPAAPTALLSGRVWDPQGRPMGEGHVWVRPKSSPWGRYDAIAGGEFSVYVPPGRVVVRVIPSWVRNVRHAPAEVRVAVPADGSAPPIEIRLRGL